MQNFKISNALEKDLMLVEDFILKKSPGDPVKKSWSLIVEFRIDREFLLRKKIDNWGHINFSCFFLKSLSSEKRKSLESI